MNRVAPPQVIACGLLLACGAGCRNTPNSDEAKPTAGEVSQTTAAPHAAARAVFEDPRDRHDFISNLSACEVRHQGLLLDFGTEAVAAWRGFSLAGSDSDVIDREGATFERIFNRERRA